MSAKDAINVFRLFLLRSCHSAGPTGRALEWLDQTVPVDSRRNPTPEHPGPMRSCSTRDPLPIAQDESISLSGRRAPAADTDDHRSRGHWLSLAYHVISSMSSAEVPSPVPVVALV